MKLKSFLVLASCALALVLGTANLHAQNRGGWDPSEFRKRATEYLRKQMDVTDDAEWKIIEERINKVMEARMSGMRFGRSSHSGDSGNESSSRRSPFGPEPTAEAQALQKAIDNKAPAEEIKARLAKVRAEIKAREAKLEKAQAELAKVLTARQEAIAVMNGLLK